MNIIKFASVLLVSLAFHTAYGQSADPVLMRINGEQVTLSDFQYAYNKTGNSNSTKDQTVDQFLESFINFKLKIEEAKYLQLNQEASFKEEYSRYLDQTEKLYTTDTVSDHIIARKIYDRLGENIQISQLFIAFPKGDILPKDTLEAYNKIVSIRESTANGGSNKFEDLVLEFSNDSVSRNSSIPGYLGWKTALMLRKDIEEAMYATAINSISQPIRTNEGYYLIKVFNKRKDPGQINLAHIFLPYPYADSDINQKDSVRSLAQEIYTKLTMGASFAQAVSIYSADEQTSPRGGVLGWFGVGNPLPTVFESTLYSLNIGEVSPPMEMDYGFHIFKILDKVYQLPWEDMKGEILKAITQSDRNELIKNLQRERLSQNYPYTLNSLVYNQLESIANTYHVTDSVYFEKVAYLDNQVLLSIEKQNYKVLDFIDFLVENPQTNFNLSTDILSHKVNDFILEKQQEVQKLTLAEKHPEFRHLIQEYYEGILLFNVMNQQVWEKAQNDTQMLQQLFDKDPLKYKWESPKYKGYVIHAKDKTTIIKAKELIKEYGNSPDLAQILSKNLNTNTAPSVHIEKGLWGKGENGFIDRSVFKTKNDREIIGYPEFIIEGKLISAPETLDDARGQVIADYQSIIETEWIKNLRNKYKVEINRDVLQSMVNQ
ncbi:peptidyl-prolyl cis-trans isomerase SurA [Dysgonomonas alginatilytica]|uniref:Peptidyl-prolyl cis-trans isomerase SurA n=1 Tax=Dysgonomonas alginatilytica TaxID=1605892 RepID=A0A2V3PTU3_9BACT|nr:peptidylprolyl isomerase [Dysgonomonas alginatilytica]PXV68002.1 peptidyl-prolyl cis-trans isomerase SurA [Dysgonomonas alginatilytica]